MLCDYMDLKEIREHLDRLDELLVLILAERQSFISKVAEYKLRNNIEIHQPKREKEIIERKIEIAKQKGLNPEFIEDLFERIIEESKRIQKEIMFKRI